MNSDTMISSCCAAISEIHRDARLDQHTVELVSAIKPYPLGVPPSRDSCQTNDKDDPTSVKCFSHSVHDSVRLEKRP